MHRFLDFAENVFGNESRNVNKPLFTQLF